MSPKGARIMNYRKLISLILCLTLLFTLTTPYASAAKIECTNLDNLIISGNYAIYYCEDRATTYCLVLDTATGASSFAVIYATQPDYVYEYLFDVAPDSIHTDSTSFWDILIADCFAEVSNSDPFYIPDTITGSTTFINASAQASSDPFENYYLNWIESTYGSPYSMKNIYTGYRGANILFIYETLEYSAGRVNTYYVKAAISIASFIINALRLSPVEAIVSALKAITPISQIIGTGTNIYEYYLYANYTRYVRMKDSSRNLNICEKHISYTGYSSTETGLSSVVESLVDTTYLPSQSYYNNKEAQINDGYAYWLQNYA